MKATGKSPSLLLCLAMDMIGFASYALPGWGEFSDIIWAPLSAIIFYKLFGGWKGAAGGILNFIEEIFPGLDFIPSFTIMWILRRYGKNEKPLSIRPV